MRKVGLLCKGVTSMDPRWLTSIGLGMDILGMVLLFFCGAIGGKWIDRQRPNADPIA